MYVRYHETHIVPTHTPREVYAWILLLSPTHGAPQFTERCIPICGTYLQRIPAARYLHGYVVLNYYNPYAGYQLKKIHTVRTTYCMRNIRVYAVPVVAVFVITQHTTYRVQAVNNYYVTLNFCYCFPSVLYLKNCGKVYIHSLI